MKSRVHRWLCRLNGHPLTRTARRVVNVSIDPAVPTTFEDYRHCWCRERVDPPWNPTLTVPGGLLRVTPSTSDVVYRSSEHDPDELRLIPRCPGCAWRPVSAGYHHVSECRRPWGPHTPSPVDVDPPSSG